MVFTGIQNYLREYNNRLSDYDIPKEERFNAKATEKRIFSLFSSDWLPGGGKKKESLLLVRFQRPRKERGRKKEIIL